jgi:hypothetical protein
MKSVNLQTDISSSEITASTIDGGFDGKEPTYNRSFDTGIEIADGQVIRINMTTFAAYDYLGYQGAEGIEESELELSEEYDGIEEQVLWILRVGSTLYYERDKRTPTVGSSTGEGLDERILATGNAPPYDFVTVPALGVLAYTHPDDATPSLYDTNKIRFTIGEEGYFFDFGFDNSQVADPNGIRGYSYFSNDPMASPVCAYNILYTKIT